MPSYEAAVAAKADMVELDFRATADGALVCVHDAKLDRYLPGASEKGLLGRAIETMTLGELRRVDIGAWKGLAGTRIPTLDEVVAYFAGCDSVLLAEHKTGSVAQTLEVLRRHGMEERAIVQSFDWEYLCELHATAPRVQVAALGGGEITAGRIEELLQTGARWAHWSEQGLTSAAVAMLHQAGLGVWVYTLNSEMAYRGAMAMGVDGVTTDRCDLAREVLGTAL